MASERDLALLDDYLGNRMDASGKEAFEQYVENNPDLQGESKFQQQIIEGLRKERAAELKAMLNRIPVSSIPPSDKIPFAAKLALAVAILIGITSGVYLFVTEPVTISPQVEFETPAVEPNQNMPAPEVIESIPENDEVEPSKEIQSTQKETTLPQVTESKPPVIDVFDPNEEVEQAADIATEGKPEGATTAAPTLIIEVDASNKKYSFHYQFKEGKLFLFGTFEDNLYEIMEFFTDNKRTAFLFYKNNYYLLNEESEKIKPLTAVTDATLLKKLRNYRKN